MQVHGRDDELAIVDGLIAEAAGGGEFRALALVGEAGIGKSTLLAATVARARAAGMLTLAGRSAEHERDVPFGLVVDALDAHAGSLHPSRIAAAGADLRAILPSTADEPPREPPPASPGERFRHHRALRALVEMLGRERPLALLLDDVHWADEASLEWVLHLLHRPPQAPCLLVLASRQSGPVSRILDALRGSGEHVALRPLDHDAALAVVGEVADAALAERIVAEAGGNPLFLGELARSAPAIGTRLPATLVAVIEQEAAALPPDARRLLEGAAVAGDPFDPELAAAAAGVPEADALATLDALAARGLVAPTGEARAFAFRHPLVRRVVYDRAAAAWRLAAHERVARALADRGAPPAMRAYHVERFARPGDGEGAALLERAAAEVATTAPATAARWYAAALALLPHDDAAARAGLLAPMAAALAASGRIEEAVETYDAALAEPGTPVEPAALAAAAARLERLLGRHSAARARLLAALPEAPAARRAALELELAVVAFSTHDYEGTLRHGRAAMDAQAPGGGAAEAVGAAIAAWVAIVSESSAQAAVAEAERVTRALPRHVPSEATGWTGHAAFQAEHFGAAAELLGRSAAAAARDHEDHLLPQLRVMRGIALLFDLDPRAALADTEAAEDGARLQGVEAQVGHAQHAVALVLDVLGRRADAVRIAQDAQDLLVRAEPSVFSTAGRAYNAVLLHEPDPERMLAELLPLLGPGATLLERLSSLLTYMVPAAIALGRDGEARGWIDVVRTRNAARELPATNVRLACADAELALAGGDSATAARLATGAVEAADRGAVRLDGARARIVAGRALAAAGRGEEAAAALERVVVDAGRAGAEQLVAEAAREIRRAGGRVSAGARRAAGGNGELSERERSIAALVAAGRSNKEVAAELFLSPKTVENNLSRIYAKLGLRTRADLARTFADPDRR